MDDPAGRQYVHVMGPLSRETSGELPVRVARFPSAAVVALAKSILIDAEIEFFTRNEPSGHLDVIYDATLNACEVYVAPADAERARQLLARLDQLPCR